MMTLVFDGLIVLVVLALMAQILRVERRLRRMQSSFGAMRALVEEFSVRVDKSQTLFQEMRSAGESVCHTLEQSMEACARQNRELRVLLAHCRRAEHRLRAASTAAAAAERDAGMGDAEPPASPPAVPAPSRREPLQSGADPDTLDPLPASTGNALRRWSPPPAPGSAPAPTPGLAQRPNKNRPDVARLLDSIRTYNDRRPEESPAVPRDVAPRR
ncbi:MAG: hypothetical protein ACFB6R_17890 [Alphaproteobacteria bacterium]